MSSFKLGCFLFTVKACSPQTSQSPPAQALVFYHQIYVHVNFHQSVDFVVKTGNLKIAPVLFYKRFYGVGLLVNVVNC